MKNDQEAVAKKLLREAKWSASRTAKVWRRLIFTLGFAQCRHCVHCDMEDSTKYRGVRESILPNSGRCMWGERKPSNTLDREDLKKVHRCPGVEQILYNFKDYGFPAEQVAKIREKRWRLFITWAGWVLAVALAFFGWVTSD